MAPAPRLETPEMGAIFASSPKAKPPLADLGFGRFFSDHMIQMMWRNGQWQKPNLLPYGSIALDPAACVLHYSQALFEGLKAFRGVDGKLRLFRPRFHGERMQGGAVRLSMPPVPLDLFLSLARDLCRVDSSWVPNSEGAALYLRPTLIGTEGFLGVRPAQEYMFFLIASPVGAYYSEGFNPVKIWVEEEQIRAAKGGLGAIKAGANYAASLQAAQRAKSKGYAQVLWLDALDRDQVEEVGTMNVFFRFRDGFATPPLSGTILNGATRDAVIQLLRSWGEKVEERRVSLSEVSQAAANGQLLEVFGTGTAAVVSPVAELARPYGKISINGGRVGEFTQKLFNSITSTQYARGPDPFGWTEVVEGA
jgi:branched-chain amino acid aminotransferase